MSYLYAAKLNKYTKLQFPKDILNKLQLIRFMISSTYNKHKRGSFLRDREEKTMHQSKYGIYSQS